MQWLSRCSDIDDRKKVRTLFRVENDCSDVADVIGIVKYNLRRVCTSDSSDLKTV